MADEPKPFRTLRGFVEGHETDEATYFSYSATLRISGPALDFALIESTLGHSPTFSRRKGEPARPGSKPLPHDCWHLNAGLAEEAALHEHIDALWSQVNHARGFLLDLKRVAKVDVFLGYRSNCDHAGVEVPYESLAMFIALEIPFGLSIIVA